jgi:multiple sugar transport system substrate-binding protein
MSLDMLLLPVPVCRLAIRLTAPDAPARRDKRRSPRHLAILVMLLLLASCRPTAPSGPTQINLHIFPEPSSAFVRAVENCNRAAKGAYTIVHQPLPRSADGQRREIVRRLAAKDSSLDILGLDVVWTSELAEAGWIREWTGASKAQALEGTLDVPLATASWKGKLYAAPFIANAQLLWYRSDLIASPPRTWDEMIAMAEQLAGAGKPHYIEIQGAEYEGLTVWFNTLVESAGGSILSPDGRSAGLKTGALEALQVMGKLAASKAADPSLNTAMEDQTRLRMEAGVAAFALNWPFVYPSMKANRPDLFAHFKWAPYPRALPGKPARVTLGGSNLAVSAFTPHPVQAFEAALCLRNREHQVINATLGGLFPTLRDAYDDPRVIAQAPYAPMILDAIANGSARPQTPAYQNVSIVVAHTLSPAGKVAPDEALKTLRARLPDALESRGLIP